jgi:hypothetical protein
MENFSMNQDKSFIVRSLSTLRRSCFTVLRFSFYVFFMFLFFFWPELIENPGTQPRGARRALA